MAKKVKSANVVPGGQLNNLLNMLPDKIAKFKSSKSFYLLLIALGILLLAIYKKDWFVAALVNGTPITNFELQSKLNEQFRTQTLNQIINEKIIMLEANKNGVTVQDMEINAKIAELEGNVGGKEALDNLLSQQGQTKDSLRNQIRVQLAITKLYEKDATVSAEEVSKFVEENKAQLRATDSAAQQKEAYDALQQQKLSQIFSQKFQELRQKAKIQTF